MTEFEFTLVVSVGEHTYEYWVENLALWADRFHDAGCDDAIVAYRNDELKLTFLRTAPDMQSAIKSAVQDIETTGAKVIQAELE